MRTRLPFVKRTVDSLSVAAAGFCLASCFALPSWPEPGSAVTNKTSTSRMLRKTMTASLKRKGGYELGWIVTQIRSHW